MRTAGAFAASLDADSEGEEGKYYVWDAEEIDRLLGADAPVFKLAYGITAHGNFEGHNIPNRLHEPGLPPAGQQALLARCRATLLAARAKRVPPGRDDKLLADWNGLMIRGLAEAGLRFGAPAWIETAASAFRAIVEHMSEGDRLRHSWRDGRALPMAFLDDYAQLARAAVALFEATGEPAWLEKAAAWLEVCDRDFQDEDGGYFLTASEGDRLIVRPKNAHDGPTPSANGTLAETSAALWHLTGDDRHRQRAEAIIAAFSGEARRNPFSHATLLGATLMLADAVQIVLVGPADATGMDELAEVAAGAALPARLLMRVADPGMLAEGHPASGKGMVEGRPTAYVCVGATCLAPATDPGDAPGAARRDGGPVARVGAGAKREGRIMSKRIVATKHGGPEVLSVIDDEPPAPKSGEVTLRHTAIGLNFIDTYHRSGLYPTKPPFTPGLEAAGVIEAVGPDVDGSRGRPACRLRLGQRPAPMPSGAPCRPRRWCRCRIPSRTRRLPR